MLGRTPVYRNDGSAPSIADTVAETEELFTFSTIFQGHSASFSHMDTVSLFSVDTLRGLTPYTAAATPAHIEESAWIHTMLRRSTFWINSLSVDRSRTLETESKLAASVRWRGTRLATWVDGDSGSTLIGGIHWEATEPRRLSPADYGPLLYWFRRDLLKRVRPGYLGEKISSAVGDTIQLDGVYIARDYYREMRLATEGRVFFETEDGRFGLGPGSMAPGDEIHILPGGKTHFVLRRRPKSRNEFELIGDCFLDSEQDYHSEPQKEEATMKGSLPWEVLGLMCLQNGCSGDGRRKIFLS
ncbi:hypothetical protein F5Y07DRAFT_412954 [Xylaria sp. FL0933]|nr:hypothetical protein F5Y07DRAFT_412954 [Xylaria sp. FL0933]